MALSERERRILEEIEDELRRDDPELAERVTRLGEREEDRRPVFTRWWFIALAVLVTVALLVLAVASA
ncbi:DUF3040 domain-containing protein [Nonomuraea sp. CA-218870]|uniref:DUF3040 domain-containing protein n=1 Tax=Nonomuraea corallina TaxID=2989783 RepID=A0ABT4SJG9_9ACTN|nr:DUF3040 domain-containing protein [Nonomuraea corallina]MDA0637085.1 DUF3040 domain-containing protein [Nonomuraea corallina]